MKEGYIILEQQAVDKKVIFIFVNIVISCIASSMLQTALTTALPPMIDDLGIAVTTGSG